LIGFNKDFLSRVLGFVWVGEYRCAKLEDPSLIFPHQVCIGFPLAGKNCLNDLDIFDRFSSDVVNLRERTGWYDSK
jgi:hypothetical protein